MKPTDYHIGFASITFTYPLHIVEDSSHINLEDTVKKLLSSDVNLLSSLGVPVVNTEVYVDIDDLDTITPKTKHLLKVTEGQVELYKG